ncbi:hypothetical protein APR09_004703 [Nocardia amikacinitolerans]|nr:hypothetical protein [Nocardia amikacinitolerans]
MVQGNMGMYGRTTRQSVVVRVKRRMMDRYQAATARDACATGILVPFGPAISRSEIPQGSVDSASERGGRHR